MAHEILEHDQMMSARNITPWHGLGEIIDEIGIPDLRRIMGWEVEKIPLRTKSFVACQGNVAFSGLDVDAFAYVRMPRTNKEHAITLRTYKG